MKKPVVSVICLCYNHADHVTQAIESVLHQTYEHIELIVVDDASIDGSKSVIENMAKIHGFQTIFNPSNLGNCKSFNIGFSLSHGKYIIDLAADDLLLPERIQVGVDVMKQKGESYGVHFSDVELIKEDGKSMGTHFKRNDFGELVEHVPTGDVYCTLVEKYFICTPSMMMSRSALDKLNGYDESLSYEDFDFWVRSSRNYYYAFSDQVLVRKKILDKSLSTWQYEKKNKHALSTAIVCEKALKLNKTPQENSALLKRINYELKWALITENWEAAQLFIKLKEKIADPSIVIWIQSLIIKIKPPWYPLWKMLI